MQGNGQFTKLAAELAYGKDSVPIKENRVSHLSPHGLGHHSAFYLTLASMLDPAAPCTTVPPRPKPPQLTDTPSSQSPNPYPAPAPSA